MRLSHLGDVTHALPVFYALRERHRSAEIAWVVQPEFSGLLEGLPGLARILPFDRRGGFGAWRRLRRELAAFSADLAVDAQGNLKSAAATWLTRAPRRVGMHRNDWREPLGARVLTEQAPPAPPDAVHALDRMRGLADHVRERATAPRLDLGLSRDELERGRLELERRSPDGDGALVLVHLATPGDVRSWPEHGFLDLLRRLGEVRRPTIVLSGPSESELGTRIRSLLGDSPTVRHWAGQSGLRELASFFTAASAAGARIVACDSGPLHLAAACGLPVLGLSGPQDPLRTGPWPTSPPTPHRTLSASPAPQCAPCLARRCTHPDGAVCLSRLPAERVFRELS